MALSSGLGMAAIFWRRERLVCGIPMLDFPIVGNPVLPLPALGIARISSPMRAFAASPTSSALFFTKASLRVFGKSTGATHMTPSLPIYRKPAVTPRQRSDVSQDAGWRFLDEQPCPGFRLVAHFEAPRIGRGRAPKPPRRLPPVRRWHMHKPQLPPAAPAACACTKSSERRLPPATRVVRAVGNPPRSRQPHGGRLYHVIAAGRGREFFHVEFPCPLPPQQDIDAEVKSRFRGQALFFSQEVEQGGGAHAQRFGGELHGSPRRLQCRVPAAHRR